MIVIVMQWDGFALCRWSGREPMLDEIHPNFPVPSTDQNTYLLGNNIGEHNVVIACLPSGAYGTISAAV
jgi:hypothetical protein